MRENNFVGKVFITSSSKETQKLARDFAKNLQGGDVVALYGDLGSGKTTFIQGLAKGLGIKKRIISPTFVIVRFYELQAQKSKLKSLEPGTFCHIDLYRTESAHDLRGLGLEDILNDSSNIIAIEWAEKLKSLMLEKRIDVEFLYEKNNSRKIKFGLGL